MFLCHFKTVIRVKLKAAHTSPQATPIRTAHGPSSLPTPPIHHHQAIDPVQPPAVGIGQLRRFVPATESRCATRAAARRQPPGRPPLRLLAAGRPFQPSSAAARRPPLPLPVSLCGCARGRSRAPPTRPSLEFFASI